MAREEAIRAIINYFTENEEVFDDCIEELDSYNGYLGDDRYYEMELLDEFFNGCDVIEILNQAYFGHDADSWYTDSHGEKIYGAFDPNREYFHYNGYGNLISSYYKDYTDFIDRYAVEAMAENRRYIDSIDNNEELSDLFDALEKAEEEEVQR